MIYDCFMLLDEIDLLEIRINVLKDVVDKFVITEATTTQIGNPKPMAYPRYKHLFKGFEDRIIYNVCDDTGIPFNNQWEREQYQKNYVINGLSEAKDDDIIVFSDIDEIPNPIALKKVIENFDSQKIYHFAQRMFNFYLNYENIENYLLAHCGDYDDAGEKRWLGTKVCTKAIAAEATIDGLRSPERLKEPGERIADGGWHFSYAGGYRSSVTKRVRKKLSSFSHSNYNKLKYYNYFHIRKTIKEGRDFLGRNAIFAKVPIDDTYPKWIVDNQSKYKHFILK